MRSADPTAPLNRPGEIGLTLTILFGINSNSILFYGTNTESNFFLFLLADGSVYSTLIASFKIFLKIFFVGFEEPLVMYIGRFSIVRPIRVKIALNVVKALKLVHMKLLINKRIIINFENFLLLFVCQYFVRQWHFTEEENS